MTDDIKVINVSDNFGRRTGLDRRKISGSFNSEVRSGKERRSGPDRRCGVDRRDRMRMNFGDNHRRNGIERRSGDDRRGLTFL